MDWQDALPAEKNCNDEMSDKPSDVVEPPSLALNPADADRHHPVSRAARYRNAGTNSPGNVPLRDNEMLESATTDDWTAV